MSTVDLDAAVQMQPRSPAADTQLMDEDLELALALTWPVTDLALIASSLDALAAAHHRGPACLIPLAAKAELALIWCRPHARA